MFYDRFEELCQIRGVKPGKACEEMGLSRSLAAKWKATKTQKPSTDVLEKMSHYFNLSINDILKIGQKGNSFSAPNEKVSLLDARINELLAVSDDSIKRSMIAFLESYQNR